MDRVRCTLLYSRPESRHCRFLKSHARVFHFSKFFGPKPSPAHFGGHFVGREGIPPRYSALAGVFGAGEGFSHEKCVSDTFKTQYR